MRLPHVIPEGIVVDAPASGVDLALTILDFAGVPPLEQFHGRTLRPVISDEPAGPLRDTEDDGVGRNGGARRPALSERTAGSAYAVAELGEDRCVRSRHWKYFTVGMRGARDEYLFDLQADPGETVNLAGAGGSALSRLRKVASSQ